MSDFLEKNSIIKTYTISEVFANNECIEICFYNTQDTLQLTPEGTCCSINTFEDFDGINILKDQCISILDEDPFIESLNPMDACDETRLIIINNFTFKFRHSCNGYYSGWVRYALVGCDEVNY